MTSEPVVVFTHCLLYAGMACFFFFMMYNVSSDVKYNLIISSNKQLIKEENKSSGNNKCKNLMQLFYQMMYIIWGPFFFVVCSVKLGAFCWSLLAEVCKMSRLPGL